jgi:polyisoprenoid-binding protein YceI
MAPARRIATARSAPGPVAALLAAALLLPGWPAQAQKLLPAQSEIGFVSRQMGVPVEGRFKRFEVQVALDPHKPEAGKVSIVIDTASAGFGSPEADAEVPKPTWFDAARFPQASFQSSAIKGLGGGRFEVSGRLSIKGQTRDLVVPVSLVQSGAAPSLATTATGSFTIKRLDFRIGEGDWADTSMVANDVQVKFRLSFAGMAPL